MFAIEKILLLDNNNEKKNPEKSVAFLVGIAIYGNPIIITSDRSVVLCVTELFRTSVAKSFSEVESLCVSAEVDKKQT